MKIYLISFLFALGCSNAFSQSIVKTYYDPFTKTQLKEVYYVIPNTPVPNGLYKLYDEDRALSETGNYIKGKKVGIWKEYIGGVLSHVATYKNGKPNGMQTFYGLVSGQNKVLRLSLFKDGVPIKATDFKWYNNGIKQSEISIDVDAVLEDDGPSGENSASNGLAIFYWENGAIESKGNYIDGVRVGTWEQFQHNGLRDNVYVFDSQGNELNRTYYYLNGKLKFNQNRDKLNIVTQIYYDSLKSSIQGIKTYTNFDTNYNQGKLTKSLEKKSTDGFLTNFLITWYDNDEKPLKNKEIKIVASGTPEGNSQLFAAYNKEE